MQRLGRGVGLAALGQLQAVKSRRQAEIPTRNNIAYRAGLCTRFENVPNRSRESSRGPRDACLARLERAGAVLLPTQDSSLHSTKASRLNHVNVVKQMVGAT
ncbi:hypothetical protein IE81DRAFT_322301 [Ceraceosorus guamensis]|uniref:Uncharacterized protein n=1 Tax=Ceraceosorus guamensis TaxID=1522189 RepID=A0A316W1D0_9BASI|nr:hypothetical protein IE81DRAFT_322301 [Ceraceosorus guamensis]PWN43656.1 hypothetical protein IE81DRAFT_322301 [Ceraceosorus guamensis]